MLAKEAFKISEKNKEKNHELEEIFEKIRKTAEDGDYQISILSKNCSAENRKELQDLGYKLIITDVINSKKGMIIEKIYISWD